MLGLCCCTRAFSSCGGQGLLPSCGAWAYPCGVLARRGARALGFQAQQLWHTGLVAPWHVISSWTKDRICIPCIGRQILNHWTSREVPPFFKCIMHDACTSIVEMRKHGAVPTCVDAGADFLVHILPLPLTNSLLLLSGSVMSGAL